MLHHHLSFQFFYLFLQIRNAFQSLFIFLCLASFSIFCFLVIAFLSKWFDVPFATTNIHNKFIAYLTPSVILKIFWQNFHRLPMWSVAFPRFSSLVLPALKSHILGIHLYQSNLNEANETIKPNTYLPSMFDLEFFQGNYEGDTVFHCILSKSKQEYHCFGDPWLEELCTQKHLLSKKPLRNLLTRLVLLLPTFLSPMQISEINVMWVSFSGGRYIPPSTVRIR